MNEEQMDHIRTHCFYAASPCGRAWEVPMIQVLRDYMIFQMQMERQEKGSRSRKEIMSTVEVSDIESWFYDQYNWDLVQSQGRLVKTPTQDEIQAALDQVRNGSQVSGDKTHSPDQAARLTRRRLKNVANNSEVGGRQDTPRAKPPKL